MYREPKQGRVYGASRQHDIHPVMYRLTETDKKSKERWLGTLLRSDVLLEDSGYPSDIIVTITGGRPRAESGMPPILLEV